MIDNNVKRMVDVMEMNGHWMCVQSPLLCRRTILECIRLRFEDGGKVHIVDTVNSSYCHYTLSSIDGKSGTISIEPRYWSHNSRVWDDNDAYHESNIVIRAVHALIEKPFYYEIINNMLIIYFEGGTYHFKQIT